MAIIFACPTCKASYTVNDRSAGEKIDCKTCGQRVQVPSPPRNRTVLGESVEPTAATVPIDPLPPEPPPRPRRAEPEPDPERYRSSRDRDDYRPRKATLYNNEESVRFYSTLSRSKLEDMIEDTVGRLGRVRFSRGGTFEVEAARFRNFATDVHILGELTEGRKDGEWNLRVSYEVKPTGACIAIAIVGFFLILIGPLILLMPFTAKTEVQRAVDRAVREMRDEAEPRRERDR
jgi:DNA-directed RNA polymerase subunit RPC12/RpoP